jgi:carbon storage regulator
MLVLSRHVDESIVLGDGDKYPFVEVTIVDVRGDKVRIGIQAPKSIPVDRKEIHLRKQADKAA